MSTTVWAVTTGSYSDYRIKALFTSKKLAEAHAAALRGDQDGWDRDASVESFELFEAAPRRVPIHERWCRLHAVTGEVVAERVDARPQWEYGDLYGPAKPIMGARTFHAPAYGKDTLVEVIGASKARVEKAYQDRIAQARAKILGVAP